MIPIISSYGSKITLNGNCTVEDGASIYFCSSYWVLPTGTHEFYAGTGNANAAYRLAPGACHMKGSGTFKKTGAGAIDFWTSPTISNSEFTGKLYFQGGTAQLYGQKFPYAAEVTVDGCTLRSWNGGDQFGTDKTVLKFLNAGTYSPNGGSGNTQHVKELWIGADQMANGSWAGGASILADHYKPSVFLTNAKVVVKDGEGCPGGDEQVCEFTDGEAEGGYYYMSNAKNWTNGRAPLYPADTLAFNPSKHVTVYADTFGSANMTIKDLVFKGAGVDVYIYKSWEPHKFSSGSLTILGDIKSEGTPDVGYNYIGADGTVTFTEGTHYLDIQGSKVGFAASAVAAGTNVKLIKKGAGTWWDNSNKNATLAGTLEVQQGDVAFSSSKTGKFAGFTEVDLAGGRLLYYKNTPILADDVTLKIASNSAIYTGVKDMEVKCSHMIYDGKDLRAGMYGPSALATKHPAYLTGLGYVNVTVGGPVTPLIMMLK